MHLAALEGNIKAFVVLLAHRADVTIKNGQGKTCFDLLKSAKDKLAILSKISIPPSLPMDLSLFEVMIPVMLTASPSCQAM